MHRSGPRHRGWAVEWVEGAGRRPAAALLAGWLAGALGLPPEAMHPVDAERTAVRIGATPSDRQGTFASEQVAGDRQGRVVRVTASAGTTDTAATAGVGRPTGGSSGWGRRRWPPASSGRSAPPAATPPGGPHW